MNQLSFDCNVIFLGVSNGTSTHQLGYFNEVYKINGAIMLGSPDTKYLHVHWVDGVEFMFRECREDNFWCRKCRTCTYIDLHMLGLILRRGTNVSSRTGMSQLRRTNQRQRGEGGQ